MAAPNAAGFIPNETIFDTIIKLFNTFGADAKDRRGAEIDQTRAQTANVNDTMAWRSDQSAQNWEQLRQQGVRNDYLPDQSAQGWEDIRLRNADQDQRARQFSESLELNKAGQGLDREKLDLTKRAQDYSQGMGLDEAARQWFQAQTHEKAVGQQGKALERTSDPKVQSIDQLLQLLSNPNFAMSIPENIRQALSVGLAQQLSQVSENPASNALSNQMSRQAAETARVQADMQAPPARGGGSDTLKDILGLIATGGVVNPRALGSLFNNPTPAANAGTIPPRSTTAPQTPATTPPPAQGIPRPVQSGGTSSAPRVGQSASYQEPDLPQDPTGGIWDMISPAVLTGGGDTGGPMATPGPRALNQYGLPDWLLQFLQTSTTASNTPR